MRSSEKSMSICGQLTQERGPDIVRNKHDYEGDRRGRYSRGRSGRCTRGLGTCHHRCDPRQECFSRRKPLERSKDERKAEEEGEEGEGEMVVGRERRGNEEGG